MEGEEDSQLGHWERFLEVWKEDIYLQLSVYGMAVFLVLCVFIVVCWFRHGTTISAMVDTRNSKESNNQRSHSSSDFEGSKSYYIPWQQEAFMLSPETKKVEQAIKKRQ